MAEKYLNSKSSAGALNKLYADMMTHQGKLVDYTDKKCQFTRKMDECILESLYFTNQSRYIMGEMRECYEACTEQSDNSEKCKMTCV